MVGLVDISKDLNNGSATLEPFPPGTFEEYSLSEDGKAKLIRSGVYHTPGDKPSFLPFVLYEGN